MEETLKDKKRLNKIITDEIKDVVKKYKKDRKTLLIYTEDEEEVSLEEEVRSYTVTLFLSREGYFKKITAPSLRMNSEQKLKENDEIKTIIESDNKDEVLFFTDKCQVYKAKINSFSDTKSSAMGDFIASKLGMDNGENVLFMVTNKDYKGHLMFFYENGRVSKVPMSSYETKTNRKKLVNGFNDKSPLKFMEFISETKDYVISTKNNRIGVLSSDLIPEKVTKSTQGVIVLSLKKNDVVLDVTDDVNSVGDNINRYRLKKVPSTGSIKKEVVEQISF